jgi:CBS domain-containing protein
MAKRLWTVGMDETVEQVEELLNTHKLSAVPVVDAKNTIFGIISTPDLLQFNASQKNPKVVRAWELCTHKPITVSPDTSVREVAKLMVDKKIHHIPVTENQKLCGFVSSLDFVEQYVLKRGT